MEFTIHTHNSIALAELQEPYLINDTEDMVDALGNADYQGARKLIVHSKQLHPDFFDLKSGIAGEILQKISNYRMQLAIVGDFSNIQSKSLRDFIYESNKQGQVYFVASLEEAKEKLAD